MMINHKAKGSRNERRSIRLLEAAGYAVPRAAASLGVFDVIGVGVTDMALGKSKRAIGRTLRRLDKSRS
jgi:Holliday junction resolvase